MPSPFPGIDPYVEAQGRWQGFHHSVLSCYLEALNERLPSDYVAVVEEEMRLVHESSDDLGRPYPDVAIARDVTATHHQPQAHGAVATLEPVSIPLAKGLVEEVRHAWIEIRKLPDLELVTVIELLSPTNKVGRGRAEYLEKRDEYIERPIHIVELDFLVAGHRLPMKRPLPPGDFHAIVSRAERRPDADVYSWTVRDPLPSIPIPLSTPDPDVPLELGPACAITHDRGRYWRFLKYREPLELTLAQEDRSWSEALVKVESA